MKSLALALITLFVAGPSTEVIARSATPTSFSLTLEHRGNTWSAHCAIGCKWTAVSVTCRETCAVIVDDEGMVTAQSGRRDSETFAFVAEPTSNGWSAKAYVGTAWESPSVSCTITRCLGSVSETGVSNP